MDIIYSIDLTEMIAFSVIASVGSIVLLSLLIKVVFWFIRGHDYRWLSVVIFVIVLLTISFGLILFSSDAICSVGFIIKAQKGSCEVEVGEFSIVDVEEVYHRDVFLGYRATVLCAGYKLDAANTFSSEEIEALKKQKRAKISFNYIKEDLYIVRVEKANSIP